MERKMSYYFSKKVSLTYEQAIEKVTAELKQSGFGILTEIDVKATLKTKLDVDFPKYKILGACNPKFAHQALLAENHIGTMLPCNVIVRETEDGQIEVAAIDPVASMAAVKNDQLGQISGQVQNLLKEVIARV